MPLKWAVTYMPDCPIIEEMIDNKRKNQARQEYCIVLN